MEKNKTQRSKAMQWAVLWALGLAGLASFIVLAAEDNPHEPSSLTGFVLTKAAAMAVLLLCAYAGRRLHKAGHLPEELDEDEDI